MKKLPGRLTAAPSGSNRASKSDELPTRSCVAVRLQEHGVEQRGTDVRECGGGVDREVHVVRAIAIRHVGAAIEWPAIRNGQKDIVETGVGQRRSEAAERRLIDTGGGVIELTDLLAVEARLVEVGAGHEADADQRDAGIGGAKRCDENEKMRPNADNSAGPRCFMMCSL